MNDIIATTQLLGALQGFLLGTVIISRKNKRPDSRIFSVMVLLVSLSMLGRFFIDSEMFTMAMILGFIVLPGMLLFGPLLYLYTRVVTGELENIPHSFLYHAIPAAAVFIFHCALFVLGEQRPFPGRPPVHPPPPANIGMGFLVVSTMCYLAFSWRLLVRYGKRFNGEISPLNKCNITWMRVLLGSMTVIFILMNVLLWTGSQSANLPDMRPMGPLLMVIFIFIVTFFALSQPEIFREIMPADDGGRCSIELVSVEKTEKKYGKHSLDDISGRRYANLLTDYMEKEKPYLDEDLTLAGLADDVGISAHHLSIVINLHLGQNFYHFINRYRVEEVKKKLADGGNCDKSILSIAYESGFNSKAAFNKFFKKDTGKTPSEYRKNIPEYR